MSLAGYKIRIKEPTSMQGLCRILLLPEHILKSWVKTKFYKMLIKGLAEAE
jgi:hypothetical protein